MEARGVAGWGSLVTSVLASAFDVGDPSLGLTSGVGDRLGFGLPNGGRGLVWSASVGHTDLFASGWRDWVEG